MAKRDYLVDAAKQIRLALDREVSEDYEAAFSYYKNGVDLLLSGVQGVSIRNGPALSVSVHQGDFIAMLATEDVDPNKERREAVKRKTTQYLKRAEEIFISHLQDSLGKGTSQFGGYSSLRFRPIRNLSSPVEDLEMCKVVGIIDKVLFVQSLISKETFVVKSLPKSSGACREHPTIIPQGIPFMVKLLRYYVSEDSVYLHLEHIQGGRLFSKLHTFRSEALREHPECCGPRRHKIRLKNSYTSPAIGQECHRNGTWSSGMATLPGSESPDTDSLTSWDETQHQLESCQTHSYCEETGCLQNSRTGKSHLSLIIQTDDVQSRRFPADARFPYPKSQENLPPPIHPCVIVDTRDPLCVTSDLLGNDVRIERIESSLDFDVAWNAAGSTQDGGNSSSSLTQEGESIPQITPTSMCGGGSQPDVCDTVNIQSQRIRIISNTLQLPIQNQSQDSKRTTQASCWQSTDVSGTTGLGRDSPPGFREELSREDAMLDCRTSEPWDRSERSQIATGGCSGNPRSRTISPHHLEESQLLRYRSSSPHVTLVNVAEPSQATTAAVKEVGMEAVEAKDEGQGVHGPLCRPSEMDSLTHLLAPSAYASQQEPEMDQLIEVDGWCHLPQFKARGFSARPKQGRWGMPEDEVRIWGAQILLALEGLHEQGILCQDLNPNNILLNSNGKVCLTFFGLWSEVQSEISPKAMEQMYCAPEIGGVSKITEACDWWSLGALLFELLTGMPLWQCHPAGVRPHTQLLIPDHLSTAAASLLTELLQFDAGYRLGCGGGGVSDIKCHPFFNSVPWHALAGPP